ncbi:MAG: Fe-S cluster assembly protein SufD [Inquilinus sp.]|nr:Fe-S cluster assembly protein SufD [Inquilinus sp.]
MTAIRAEAAEAVAMPLVDRAEVAPGGLPGGGLAWADALRTNGLARFRALGVPSRKVESWKYTDVRKLAARDYAPAPAHVDGLSAVLRDEVEAAAAAEHSLVFVNGGLRRDLSKTGGLPNGATLESTGELLAAGDALLAEQLGRVGDADDQAFLSLNAALMRDGFVLRLAPDTVVEAPIRVAFLTDHADGPVATHPRNLVVVGDNAQATLVEIHRGLNGVEYFSNAVTEISVGAGARLHHYKLQDEGDAALHLANSPVRLGRDTTYDSFILSFGALMARNDIRAELAAPGIDCRLSGAYVARGRQHMDTTTAIDHAVPDCRSREVYAGVLDDQARGVFQGKIVVRRDAQRTDGHQLNRALLLSKGAEIDSKPELEIYADDVKCSHGATAGEIDADALFYLRARGIDADVARALLIEAFLMESLQEVQVEAVREEFAARLKARLALLRGDR